jgi:hypothetical protein
MTMGGLLLRPRCGHIDPHTEARCGLPAYYEFELNPRHWPDAKPPIIQWACQEHGKQARTMVGLIWIKAI